MIFFLSTACSVDEVTSGPVPGFELVLNKSFELDVLEPSGLTFDPRDNTLWTVSDNTNMVYKMSLEGEVLDTLPFVGEDLEGVVYDPSTSSLWLIEEQLHDLIRLNAAGEEISRYHLDIPSTGNSGLEGICVDDTGSFYLLNEKNPGLFIALNPDFSIARTVELEFAGDYSGMEYSAEFEAFWIVSDQEEMLYLWDGESEIMMSFELDIPKAEGVALRPDTGEFYIVSDDEQKLYVLTLEYNR